MAKGKPTHDEEDAEHGKRPKISQALKFQVWEASMGDHLRGKCPVPWCTQQVTYINCVLAHNVPFSKGGATDASNLSITCAACNSGMGNRYTVEEWGKLGGAGAPARYAATAAAVEVVPPSTQGAAPMCGCWG